MPLPDIDTVLDWRGRTVIDRDGEKIGKFDEIYLDEETSQPEWAAVTTGLFGRKQTFVPLSGAQLADDDVQVPFDQEQVKNAPSVDPEDALSQDEEERLYEHYGMGYSRSDSGTVLPEGEAPGGGEEAASGETATGAAAGGAATGAATGEAAGEGRSDRTDEAASGQASETSERASAAGPPERASAAGPTASETPERASAAGPATGSPSGETVAATTRPRERVRLKKYVVTEEVTTKVPVSREEVRLEREPVDDAEAASRGEGVTETDEEIVLSEDEPLVEDDRRRQ
jgi:sporulation protein YlmC with PRC-barrel domain